MSTNDDSTNTQRSCLLVTKLHLFTSWFPYFLETLFLNFKKYTYEYIHTANQFPYQYRQVGRFVTGTEFSAFSNCCDLESRSRSIRLAPKCRVQYIYHHINFEPYWFANIQTHANVCFLMQSVKQLIFPLFHKLSLKLVKRAIKVFSLNCFNTILDFILISWKLCKKMKSVDFALHWHCEP